MGPGSRTPLCIASSHGGHLELMLAVEEAWRGIPHAFIMPPSRQADALRERGERVELVENPQRRPARVVVSACRALRLAWRERPRVVVSAGANAALAFCVAARLLGARLIFVETMARVHQGSLTGRLLHRIAHHFLVQWPELLAVYPRAELCRPALLEDVAPETGGLGTFVAAGTHRQPFTRLLSVADDGVQRGVLPAPVTAQTGSAVPPPTVGGQPTLSPAQVEQAVREHELVLCHGGSGLISLALRNGKTPLVLPRRAAHGEHVDDHQVDMVAKLAALGYVASLDELGLDKAVTLARSHTAARAAAPPGPALAERLRDLLEEAL